MKSDITIVVPVYNPHQAWEKILVTRDQELSNTMTDWSCSMALVNDGSQIHVTQEAIQYIKQHIPHLVYIHNTENHGKGFVLRQAISELNTPYILYTDIDMPFTVASMQAVMSQLHSYDVVFGIKQQTYYEQLPLQRKMVSKILQRFIKILFPTLPVSDTQCGLKGMNALGKTIFMQTKIDRYLFDLEFILYASKQRLKIKPIPVSLREGIVFGNMNYKILLQESKNLWKILNRK